MEKIILLAAITVFGIATSNAQTAKKAAKKADAPVKVETQKVDGPGMVFENETIDFGTIPHNADGNREFVFVNNGNKPLKIESTQGSCGCTVPTKPEGDIAPGAKGTIGVKYDTNREGPFTKTVTIKSNAVGQETKVVTIKGTVLPDPNKKPAESAAPTKS
jgi:hypothetical protein